ncbi:MAG: tRNA 2-thiouridine(34) synthase MnmA [Anaerolineae bacterium]
MKTCVAVAMSGGVDSSVSAALLLDQGYEVIGLGMRLPQPEEVLKPGHCCGMQGMADAQHVADLLGIAFYELDCRTAFEYQVIAPFCAAYAAGQTPNPCVWCNTIFKFGFLLDIAQSWGATMLASGHYARLEQLTDGWPVLRKGLDYRRDQSYFLAGVPVDRLRRLLFPLGALQKDEVRKIALQKGLPVADKPGSQDICFVGPQGYAALLAERQPQALQPGPILDTAGRVLGRHHGLGRYTLGQREGLGIAAPRPLYVIAIEPASNSLVVGPKDTITSADLHSKEVNWLLPTPPEGVLRVNVKTRYHGAEAPATVTTDGEGASVRFDTPQPLAAPGQTAVFYEGDRVLGGGVIC